jgi:hypothetical protein
VSLNSRVEAMGAGDRGRGRGWNPADISIRDGGERGDAFDGLGESFASSFRLAAKRRS